MKRKKSPSKHSSMPLHEQLLRLLEDGKAVDVVAIDLAGKSDIADHMVIASGTSSRHAIALADKVIEFLKTTGTHSYAAEGLREGNWVLVDAGTVIVHVFLPEIREMYDLEKMWSVALPQERSL